MDGEVLIHGVGYFAVLFVCEIVFCIVKCRYEFMQNCGVFCFLI